MELERLIYNFPKNKYKEEAEFKLGVISLYTLGNREKGKDFLARVIKEGSDINYRLLSLYHLGLILQWEGDFKGALEYYRKISELDKERIPFDLKDALSARISEINSNFPIQYNLRTFLDACFGKSSSLRKDSKLELKVSPFNAHVGDEVTFSASTFLPSVGCLPQKMGYLWSGQIAGKKPPLDSSRFSIIYNQSGTKVINVVAVTPSGVINKAVAIVDID